jgi:hypothetical protein
MPAAAPAAANGGFARVAEIRVELAWLADPTTFPYELAAHSTGASLEVGGMVPNGAVRDRALQVARAQSPLPVVDRLLIQPGSGNPPVKMGDANLCRAAGEALGKMLAGHSEPYQVASEPGGQITLLGTVPSCEDKLRISRRMSQLTGCTSVINSMVVARTTYDGQIYTTVSADGTLLVAGDPLDLLPPPAVTVAPSTAVVQGRPGSGGVSVMSVDNSPVVSMVGMVSTVSEPRLQPVPSAALVMSQGSPYTAPTFAPQPYSVPIAPMPMAAAPSQGSGPMVIAVPVSPYGGSVPRPIVKYVLTPSGYAPQQQPVQPAQLPAVLVSAPAIRQPSRIVPTPAANGPIQLASATQIETKTARQAVQPIPTRATPAKNTVAPPANGLARPATREMEPAKPLTPNQAHIKRLIEVACGDAGRDVVVKPIGNNRLVINLRVSNAGDGQRLGERILMMPELEPYKVDLDMEVKP